MSVLENELVDYGGDSSDEEAIIPPVNDKADADESSNSKVQSNAIVKNKKNTTVSYFDNFDSDDDDSDRSLDTRNGVPVYLLNEADFLDKYGGSSDKYKAELEEKIRSYQRKPTTNPPTSIDTSKSALINSDSVTQSDDPKVSVIKNKASSSTTNVSKSSKFSSANNSNKKLNASNFSQTNHQIRNSRSNNYNQNHYCHSHNHNRRHNINHSNKHHSHHQYQRYRHRNFNNHTHYGPYQHNHRNFPFNHGHQYHQPNHPPYHRPYHHQNHLRNPQRNHHPSHNVHRPALPSNRWKPPNDKNLDFVSFRTGEYDSASHSDASSFISKRKQHCGDESDLLSISSIQFKKQKSSSSSDSAEHVRTDKKKSSSPTVNEICDGISMITEIDGSTRFFDTVKKEYLVSVSLSNDVFLITMRNGSSKTFDSKSSTFLTDKDASTPLFASSQKKGKKTSPPHWLHTSQQVSRILRLKGKYPSIENTDNIIDGFGLLSSYTRSRSNRIMEAALSGNSNEKLLKFDVIREPVALLDTSKKQKTLHFGTVSNALGLNKNNTFLFKVCFGNPGTVKWKYFDGYLSSHKQWNAVCTLHEVSSLIVNLDINDVDTYTKVRNTPDDHSLNKIHRIEFENNSSKKKRDKSTKKKNDKVGTFCHYFDSLSSEQMIKVFLSKHDVSNDLFIESALNILHDRLQQNVYNTIMNRHVSIGVHHVFNEDDVEKTKDSCIVCSRTVESGSKDIHSTAMQYKPRNVLATKPLLSKQLCSKCACDSIQSFKFHERNDHLMQVLNSTVLYSSFAWGKEEVLNVSNYAHLFIRDKSTNSFLFSDTSFKTFIEEKIKYRTIDLRNHKWIQSLDRDKSTFLNLHLEGAGFDSSLCLDEYFRKAIKLPDDCDFGVIILPYGDFLMICKSNFREMDSIQLCLSETLRMKEIHIQGRSGAAGGIVSTDTNSHSMTKYTKSKTNVFIPSQKGTGISCVYNNAFHEEKSFNAVYNDVYMNRLNITTKILELQKNISYRRITIEEMKTRTYSLILGNALGLIEATDIETSFSYISNIGKIWVPQRLSKLSGSGILFETILLHQGATTGEMRNHQSLKGHVDGNKSHFLESMALFGRINESNMSEMLVKDHIKQMKPGYLFLPLFGIVLYIPCCLQSVHCRLKQTVHIPDPSRSKYNWSKVHGPCGDWVVNPSGTKISEKKSLGFIKKCQLLFNSN